MSDRSCKNEAMEAVVKAMDMTNMKVDDYDSDVFNNPDFNSTAFWPDERPHLSEGAGNPCAKTLKLSPIPKHRAQFVNSSNIPFSEQQFDSMMDGSAQFGNVFQKMSEAEHEEEVSSSLTGGGSKMPEADKENGEMGMSGSRTSFWPKSNSTVRSFITNPFDSDLMESLCATTYSPSLFDKSKKNIEEGTPEKFRWSIGQMADLHPADIDETAPLCRTPDPVVEAQIHNAIEKFWASQKYILPSPQILKESANIELTATPNSNSARRKEAVYQESPLARPVQHSSGQQCSVEVQTMFTFPPNLDLVGLLGNCFQYEEGEVPVFEANLSLDTLRQKLLFDTSSANKSPSVLETESFVVAHDDSNDCELYGNERPSWYHSNEEMVPIRRMSVDDFEDLEEAEIVDHFPSPNLSPIRN